MFRMMLVHCPSSVPYSRCTRRCGTSADTRRVSLIVKCMMQVLIPHNVQMKQVIKTLAEKQLPFKFSRATVSKCLHRLLCHAKSLHAAPLHWCSELANTAKSAARGILPRQGVKQSSLKNLKVRRPQCNARLSMEPMWQQ